MAEDSTMESVDYWRKLFRCADADIFRVIKYAILVAWSDRPDEFLAWRDQITELIYTCWREQCSTDPIKIYTPDDGGVEDYQTPKESKDSSSDEIEPTVSNECSNLDEFQALTDEIEEQQQTVGEVLRIKDLLINWKEESEEVLYDSLRRLELIEVSVELLNATKIGRVVGGLSKQHKSKPIRQLAQTLIKVWKLMADEWMKAATTTQESSPASFNPSPASEEESLLPSELDFPPLDVGALLATQAAPFEFSKFFDGMDEDGNPTSMKDSKENGRKPRQKATTLVSVDNGDSNLARKDDGGFKRQEAVTRMQKSVDSTHKDSKPPGSPSCRGVQQRQNSSGEVRKQIVVQRAARPQDAMQKASKSQDIPSTPPAPVRAARTIKLRQKSSVTPTKPCTRKDVSKESEESCYRRKLELTKRKLQDRYEEAKNAKQQRTVQVMELKDLPKQGQDKQQHLKGRQGSCFRRSLNMKSR